MWSSRRRFSGNRVVHLHIGAPKTGTTYVQNALWHNRDGLGERGLLYPLERPDEHFAMTMDLRRMPWADGFDPAWDGAWDRVVERVANSPAPRAVVSDELLGGATPDQIRRAVASFGDAEVHVVFTVRDLARALPSDWQEQVRHGHTVPYDRFVDDLITLGRDAPAPFGQMFWDLHDPMRVLPGWAEVVGPDRVHVVTVPPAGAPRDELRGRIAKVLGIAPGELKLAADASTANTSLGAGEAELIRRLNDQGRLPERLTWMYAGLVRLELGEWILAPRPGQRRIVLPARHRDRITEHAHRTMAWLREAQFPVTGDLADLVPEFTDDDADGAAVSDAELLDTALEALADLLLRLGVVQNSPG
ncbi:MAG TPA: hypothetical protein VIG48_00930 [Jatrophihabitans sp.]